MARRAPSKKTTVETPVPTTTWQAGDRVTVDFGGDWYGGEILEVKTRVAVVSFDDGEQHEIDLTRLIREPATMPENGDSDDEDDAPSRVEQDKDGDVTFNPPAKFGRGMHHYPISWDPNGVYFNCWAAPEGDDLELGESANVLLTKLRTAKNRMVHFVGTWRKTEFARADANGKIVRERCPGWSIDMYAKIEHEDGEEESYLVESLAYEAGPGQGDPRLNMHSLNSDICAAIRKWFFLELRGDAETVRQLKKRASRPQIKVPNVNWLDRFIAKCMEVRSTALRSGGQRQIVIESGNPDDPVISLCVDFTDIARATEGNVPPLYQAGILEGAVKSGGRKGAPRTAPLVITPDPENVAALTARVRELNVLAKQGDLAAKSEARKIRTALRKMGHAGGARSAAHMTKVRQPDK